MRRGDRGRACCCASRSPTLLVGADEAWAAAATLPTGVLWLLLSVERGALQGVHAYRPVGWSLVLEATGRLVFGLVLVAAGLGVTGAYLGTPLAMLARPRSALWCDRRRRLGRAGAAAPRPRALRDLMGGAWPAVVGAVPASPCCRTST